MRLIRLIGSIYISIHDAESNFNMVLHSVVVFQVEIDDIYIYIFLSVNGLIINENCGYKWSIPSVAML